MGGWGRVRGCCGVVVGGGGGGGGRFIRDKGHLLGWTVCSVSSLTATCQVLLQIVGFMEMLLMSAPVLGFEI